MAKRAWCSGCNGYVMLTADDMCPYGHPRPSLRGVEEVGYGAPPSQPELKPPTEAVPYAADGLTSATSSAYASSGATYSSGYGGAGYSGGNGTGFSSAQPTSSYVAADPVGSWGAPAAAVAVATPAWQGAASAGNPWQADVGAVGVDPMLQMQLNKDKSRILRDVPWSHTWVGIVVWLFFLWPVGMVFLWRSPIPTQNQKWGITAAFGALIAFNIVRAMLAFAAASAAMPVMPVAHP